MNKFSHIDLRVSDLEHVLPFYEKLLPALGFTQTFHSEKWRVFAAEGDLPSVAYVAITEDRNHKPNANLIGFWANDRDEVDRIANLVELTCASPLTDWPRWSRTFFELNPLSPCLFVFCSAT